ncbi:MAG: DUF805 domain-containing protein [Roseomonas sp.]|nr:DUF805 domain-containing protein [Roseomonas sp.]MCA3429986.1 DUF805 domain-containing protein [Roseomonas sp.]MCA3434387.1 DUF805 domain-containing protein [Roseomonas sp.]
MTLAQWFSFNGRISRKTWWIFYFLIPIGINIAATAIEAQFLGFGDAVPDHAGMGSMGMGPIGIIAAVGGLWVTLAGQAKRWHDRDKSAWWVLVYFIPLIGWLWSFIVAGFLRGTPGYNRFGPDPLAPELPPGGYGGGYQPPYPPQAPGGWQPQGPPPPPSGGWGAPPPPPQGGGSVPPIRRG